MAPRNQQNRLGTPEIIDIDGDTGRPFDDDTDTSSLESDQDKLLDDIIGEFGAADNEISYKASITRIPTGFQRGQKEPWLFECDASQIVGIRTTLRDAYRGGNFRIRVYRTTGKGTKLYRQMDYSIEPPANTAQNTSDPKYDALAGALERTQNQLLALSERLSQPQIAAPVAAVDPFVMMERMSTIMKNMAPAVTAPAAGGDLKMFMEAAHFVEDLRGAPSGGDGDSGFTGIVKALIQSPQFGEVAQAFLSARRPMQERMNGRNGMNRQIPQQRPMMQEQPDNNIPPETHGNDPQALGTQLQQNMRYLIGKAERNADPGLYAEWLLDNTDQNIIMPMINDPNLLNQLSGAFPRMAMFLPWFEELVSAAKQLISGEDQGEQHEPINSSAVNTQNGPGGEGGNNRNFESDGSMG